MKKTLLVLSGALAALGAHAADYNPIALNPATFTADVVVEKTATKSFADYTTATMDGGTNNNANTFFERGYVTGMPQAGLPTAGSTFSAATDSARQFKMPPSYSANNAVMLANQAGFTTGTLSLSGAPGTPLLSILATAGGGATTLNYTIHHSGGGTQTGSVAVDDWTAGSAVAVYANATVNTDNGNLGNTLYTNGTGRRVLYYDIPLSDSVNGVTSVDFAWVSGGRAMVLGASALTGATYTPITASGFDVDFVVEASAPVAGFARAVTGTMDGGPSCTGNTWYEVGYNRANPTTGIPAAGTTVTSGTRSYTLPPTYAGNCVFMMGDYAGYRSATMTLTTPAAFTGLSFLGSAGNGAHNLSITVHHASDPDEVFSPVSVGNWFDGTTFITQANGRVVPTTLAFNNVGSGNPRLYPIDVTLTGSSAVTSIDLSYLDTGNQMMIFALAGQTTGGGNFSPVAITGFNADGVVEAAQPDPRFPNPLSGYTTITMDGGTANTGNTWYEQGFYRDMPATGLPPAGSTISSLADAAKRYQMPATYTGNNSIFIDSVRTNVNVIIQPPYQTYSALSFLNSCANGTVTARAIMQYLDGTSETNTFTGSDWFNATPYAFTSRGRVNLNNNTINNDPGRNATPNPRLYEAGFALGNPGSQVTNVNLRFVSGSGANSRMVVLAVSATAGAIPPVWVVQPTDVNVNQGATTGFVGVASSPGFPITYQWYSGPRGAAPSTYAPVANGGQYSGATTTNLTVTGAGFANELGYCLVANNAAGSVTSSVANLSVVSSLPVITIPGDPITAYQPNGGSSPAAESVDHCIDGVGQKYLNFGANGGAPYAGPTGFIVTPSAGSTVCEAIRFYTANDAAERDPADYLLEGSNDGGATWAPIASGALALPAARNAGGATVLNPYTSANQEVHFANATGYSMYRWSVSAVRTPGTANSMQIAEVSLLGLPTPTPPVFTVNPAPSVKVFVGGSPTFTAVASGYPAPTYQWYTGAGALVGSGASYGFSNAQLADSGKTFYCVASNTLGAVTSSVATLTVIAAPTQAYPVAVLADQPIAFLRLGEGPDDGMGDNGVVAYDNWGGHNGTYTNVLIGQAGYPATPADPNTATDFGSTIVDGNWVPADQDSCVNNIAGIDFAAPTNTPMAFSVEAWVRQSPSAADQTTDAGIICKGYGGGGEQFNLDTAMTAVPGGQHGIRFFIHDATGGTSAANTGTNTLADGLWHHIVGVCDQPNSNLTLYVDGAVSSRVAMNPNAGIRASSYPVTIGARPSAAGTNNNFHFLGTIDEVAIYNRALSAAQVQSHYFAAGIPPTLAVSPTNTTVGEGQTVTFYSQGFGSPTLAYQWSQSTDGGATFTPMAGKTTANLTLVNVQNPNPNPPTQYQVSVTNLYGSVVSAPATLTVVSGPPTIIADIDPGPILVYAGRTFSYAAQVGGTAPITYQWKKNGSNVSNNGRITGANTATLNLNNAQGSDSGTYQLFVSNSQGNNQTIASQLYVEVIPDFNTNGLGWTANGGATFNNDVLSLTENQASQARTVYYNYPLYVGGFQAKFTYQNNGGADGMAFIAHNDPRGVTALGGAGGSLGISGIAPSAALCLNIYIPNTVGYSFVANPVTGPYQPYVPATPVALDSGNPIDVTVTYLGGTLNVAFTDTVTLGTYSANLAVNLPAVVGGSTAYIGLAGATGGANSLQTVRNFSYVPIPVLSVASTGGNAVVLSWPSAIGGYKLQSKSALDDSPSGWTDVADPGIETGGVVRVTVSPATGNNFYRLKLTE